MSESARRDNTESIVIERIRMPEQNQIASSDTTTLPLYEVELSPGSKTNR